MWLDFAELQPLLRQNEWSLQVFLSCVTDNEQPKSFESNEKCVSDIFTKKI